jgi:eukaryotic-like serine/threonine-protein kinase
MDPEPGDRSGSDALRRAVESFIERSRRGERPSVEEYVGRLESISPEAREVLDALRLVEEVGQEVVAATDAPPRAAAGRDPAPAQVGEYRILREVGRGGMGVVYEAMQTSLGRQVALKVLPQGLAGDTALLARFAREAQAAARLHHTNIVPVFGAGEAGGVHYYAMQFIEGHSLADILKEVRRLRSAPGTSGLPAGAGDGEWTVQAGARRLLGIEDSPRAGEGDPLHGLVAVRTGGDPPSSPSTSSAARSRYFRNVAAAGLQVASALAHAHGQGILHRDIKPSNLLMDARGDIWVTDFGLAKNEGGGDLTEEGDFPGTLPYMAPERFRGASDGRSDIYGLGVTLYQMAALQPAFADSDRARLVRKVLTEEPARPRRIDPRIPRDLETIILKAIEKEPSSRYQKAEALAEDLRAFLADKPLQATRASALERSRRWCRRNPISATLAGVAAVLLVVATNAVLIALWSGRAEREARYWRLISQARAHNSSGKCGQVFSSLGALGEAIRLLPRLHLGEEELDARVQEIRDEVLVAETRTDVRLAGEWSPPPDPRPSSPRSQEEYGGLDHLVLDLDAELGRCAIGYPDGQVRVFRLEDGGLVAEIPGSGAVVTCAGLDPGGTHLAIQRPGDDGCAVEVWDLAAGARILEVPGVEDKAMGFHPGEPLLALGLTGGTLCAYRLGEEEPRWRLAIDGAPAIGKLAFSPDGRDLAVSFKSGPVNEVLLLDLAKGTTLGRLEAPSRVLGLAWHPAGFRLATSCQDSCIYLWDREGRRSCAAFRGHEGEVIDLAFSHRGDLLASRAWDTTFRLWEVHSSRLLATAFSKAVSWGPRFDAGDERVVLGADFRAVDFWEVAAGRACRTLTLEGSGGKGPFAVDFSLDGRLLASTGYDGIRMWDLPTGVEVAHLALPQEELGSAIFDPAGDRLITNLAQGLFRWPVVVERDSLGDRLRIGPPEAVGKGLTGGPSGRSSLSGDGRRLALARGDRGAVIDLETGAEVLLAAPHQGLDAIAISPDGRWVGTGTWTGARVKVWDAASGALAADLPTDGRAGIAFGPDGRTLVVTEPGRFTIYETVWWRLRRTLERQNPGDLLGPVAFSPDGTILAVAATPWSIQLVESASIRVLATLATPERHLLLELRFSPDGSLLAAATAGNVIEVWDLRRIRARLASNGVDWSLPPYPPERDVVPRPPPRVEVLLGSLQPFSSRRAATP